MRSLSSWNQASLFSRPYCSGWAKSCCGGVLAIDIDDFHCQRSTWFHEIYVITMPKSLLLMIYTSFGVYLTLGTTYPKLTQNGRCLDQKARIRPTGILSVESWHENLPKSHKGRIQAIPTGWTQKYTTWTRKARTHIQKRSQPRPWSSTQHPPHPRLIHGKRGACRCNGGLKGHQRQAAWPKERWLSKPPERPSSRSNQDRPTGRRWHVEAGPSRPA
jgi:hypothetical protein